MLPTPPPSPPLKPTDDRIGYVLDGRIQLTGVLGIGAYGTVYVARDLRNDVAYAVKALNKIGLTRRQRKFLDQEICLHQRASSHPNVVSLIDVITTPETIFVVLEYCPEGDLFGNITEHAHYVGNDALAKRIFLQLLDAVEYCHSIGVYHRDLKPENILITDAGMTAKLADFGLACTESCSSDFGCGSTFYMSPECLQASPKAFSCYAAAPNDVWSLGVVLVNLTCGRNPWKRASVDDSTFAAFLRDSEFLKSILPLTDELDCILRYIFECDPARRITIPQLRQMILQCPALTTTCKATEAEYCCDATQAYVSPLTGQYSQFTTSSVSSGSESDWVTSACASPGLAPSTPWEQEFVEPTVQETFLSAPPAPWYTQFMPTLELPKAQKHLSFHPVFPTMGVFSM